MADDEIQVLWEGELALGDALFDPTFPWSEQQLVVLRLLLAEINRVRKMRVARQEARKEAKRKKRRALVAEAARGDRRVRELLDRAAQRDHTNGLEP